MNWLVVIQLLASVMKYIADKQLIDAGIAKNVATNAIATLDIIKNAKLARNAVRDDPDSVRNDPYNIDKH